MDFDRHTFLFAPIRGFTDMAYYNAYFTFFDGVDAYFLPYFSVEDKLRLNGNLLSETLKKRMVPQVLCNSIEELSVLLRFFEPYGFTEININVGCPYPMVTRRGRGAGLIAQPGIVAEMVHYINDHYPFDVSLKVRLGLTEKTDIYPFLSHIENLKLKRIIVHPRTAKQLYRGKPFVSEYFKIVKEFPGFDFVYNGDIISENIFAELQGLIPAQKSWMIGRGILSDLYLPQKLQKINQPYGAILDQKIKSFLLLLFENIKLDSSDSGHSLNRMKAHFFYLKDMFPTMKSYFKKIEKIKRADELQLFIEREF